jgi:UDP-N-acetylmuramyl pentapeptide phosphotransferase/UDP-N-acetylglucosamine-1-phosphate transferase
MSGNVMWLATSGIVIFAVAAAACFALLVLLRPVFQRYTLAHPNARSSHKIPTPQGAGIGVIAATIGTIAAASFLLDDVGSQSLWVVLAATVFIAIVGAIDDVSPIPVLPRLVLQAIAVAVVVVAIPDRMHVVPVVPHWIERTLLGFAALWFINLVNFMDGVDWMTVVETVPVTACLVVIGGFGALPKPEIALALALCGAVAGFAPLNRPVAKLFLGDVGSLSIGLLLAWLLINLAGRGHVAAALLLPLYYLADATITLLRRFLLGEPVWLAHRSHFYQRAVDGGLPVMAVVGRVFAVNVALAGLAVASIYWDGIVVQLMALLCGGALVGGLLLNCAARESAPR